MSARRSNRITETQNAVHPGMRTLNDPLNLSRAAAAWFPASGNTGRNAARVPDAPVLVATVASIRVDALRPAERPTANAVDWLNHLDDGNPLRNVVAVGASQDCRDRRTVGFGGCASAAGPAAKLPTIRTCPARGGHLQAVCARWRDGFTFMLREQTHPDHLHILMPSASAASCQRPRGFSRCLVYKTMHETRGDSQTRDEMVDRNLKSGGESRL
ncbi:Uncharacterised protein [Burkholderia pseudomallei]|nr:Uncharacterised protein [Burkholderia pseudomallei]CAJ3979705.1 Uncharacterised protein [Burkholderia pseudomallei]CAJ4079206.1 Uncharacterised protein [Burkholderia pseudomallei]CAJ4532015.1 Uncharacterised protein [Burkholderia pseudomallei]CAJ5111721.1 Uncharacterised protein [Burkholderia pseudomallei]